MNGSEINHSDKTVDDDDDDGDDNDEDNDDDDVTVDKTKLSN